MPKITSQQMDTLKLIQRSQADEDGWCRCSVPIFLVIDQMPTDLVRTRGLFAKLTHEARIVLKWLG